MTVRQDRPPVEIWGGVECTVNRLGDRFVDQLVLTGHHERPEDLDQIAALGIRTLRYPVLWERTELSPGQFDWRWADERLARLRALGIDPIVGLVHHGSGPLWTSLVDDSFARGLEVFARAVARRFPWVRRYTVVNEPLTTARFSGLYGHWFPHACDDRVFVRALLNQCHAIKAGMAAIRSVRPDAELIQTEDICETRADGAAAAQAQFYQLRRWLSLDLLCGRVAEPHPLWTYLRRWGASEAELAAFVEQPCHPDVIGLNYYVASDRYLDCQVEKYPADRRYQAARGSFVDTEAARMRCGISGHLHHIRSTWARYATPLALTEVHLNCTGEEQSRWLMEAWHAAGEAAAEGIDIRAITAWALMGAVDWDSLVTRLNGHRELGAFDTRGGMVRPRALARVTSDLALRGTTSHPAGTGSGWWRRNGSADGATQPLSGPPLLIAGRGTLARALTRAARGRGLAHVATPRHRMDIADPASVGRVLDEVRPWAILNACGYVKVDAAETNIEQCWRENVGGPAVLADEAARRGIRLMTVSSDLVFDGALQSPYLEDSAPRPLSVYGQSKAEAERVVLERCAGALVVRTAAFFEDGNDADFLAAILCDVRAGRVARAACDLIVSPTYVPDLAEAVLELLLDDATGVWHLANAGRVSWADFAEAALDRLGLPRHGVHRCAARDLGYVAPRPGFSALGTQRSALMPSLDSALDRWAARTRDSATTSAARA